MKLNKVEDVVKTILTNEPDTRGDDMQLYFLFCTKYGFLSDSGFTRIFKDKEYRNTMNLAVFESVSRARRKIQAENEHLRPNKEVQKARDEKENEYINYAIGGYQSSFMDFVDSME